MVAPIQRGPRGGGPSGQESSFDPSQLAQSAPSTIAPRDPRHLWQHRVHTLSGTVPWGSVCPSPSPWSWHPPGDTHSCWNPQERRLRECPQGWGTHWMEKASIPSLPCAHPLENHIPPLSSPRTELQLLLQRNSGANPVAFPFRTLQAGMEVKEQWP